MKSIDDTKIRINGPEQSKIIQEILFDLGWDWTSRDRRVKYTDEPFIFINSHRKKLGYTTDKKYFMRHVFKEIRIEDLIGNYEIY